jgi:hypothetical protein
MPYVLKHGTPLVEGHGAGCRASLCHQGVLDKYVSRCSAPIACRVGDQFYGLSLPWMYTGPILGAKYHVSSRVPSLTCIPPAGVTRSRDARGAGRAVGQGDLGPGDGPRNGGWKRRIGVRCVRIITVRSLSLCADRHVGVGGLVCGTPYTLGSSPSSKESRSWSRVSKNPARNTEETAVRLAPGKGTGTTLCRR